MTKPLASDEIIAGVVDAFSRVCAALAATGAPFSEQTAVSLTAMAVDRDFKTKSAEAMRQLGKLYGDANRGDEWRGDVPGE